MRLIAAALLSLSLVATADAAPSDPMPPPRTHAQASAAKPSPVMHYRTLEKMLRRFRSVAGEARTRG